MSKSPAEVTVSAITRKFLYKGQELADIHPEGSADEVRSMYASSDASLTTAEVVGPEMKEGVAFYTFKPRAATKG